MKFVLQKLEGRIRELAGLRYRESRTLADVYIAPDVKDLAEVRQQLEGGTAVRVGDRWGAETVMPGLSRMSNFRPTGRGRMSLVSSSWGIQAEGIPAGMKHRCIWTESRCRRLTAIMRSCFFRKMQWREAMQSWPFMRGAD